MVGALRDFVEHAQNRKSNMLHKIKCFREPSREYICLREVINYVNSGILLEATR